MPPPSGNIKVNVRVRPFNKAELGRNDELCVAALTRVDLSVHATSKQGIEKDFPYTFDRVYWSHNPDDPTFATQQTLMDEMGHDLEKNSLEGYNNCLFAYGQTGAGKTFSVLGGEGDLKGLLPRLVDRFFDVKTEKAQEAEPTTFEFCVSFMEIYNETLRDLLAPPSKKGEEPLELKIRHPPNRACFVDGLIKAPVDKKEQVWDLLDYGTKARTVGATAMNAESSRSHCIFTFSLKSNQKGRTGQNVTIRSDVNLVDLAGSERARKTGAEGSRLKEGCAINQSLSILAQVISGLAKREKFIRFRSSKLTELLEDSLAGNSKTVMMAAVSPSAYNAEETMGTLEFASSVKNIKTSAKATKQAGSDADIVKKLQAEIERLNKLVLDTSSKPQESLDEAVVAEEHQKIQEELEALRALETQMIKDVEEARRVAEEMTQKRQAAMEDMGVSASEMADNLGLAQTTPHLVNVSADPALMGTLTFFLIAGSEVAIGTGEEDKIKLQGLGMSAGMATIKNEDDTQVSIEAAEGVRVLLNGGKVKKPETLSHGSRLLLGYSFCFCVVIPALKDQVEARTMDEKFLESALAEVAPEESEVYGAAMQWVGQLRDRIGLTRAEVFTMQFKKLASLVDEANEISKAVRPQERFEFCPEATVDIFHCQEETPECAVRLKKWPSGLQRFKSFAKGARRHSAASDILDVVGSLKVGEKKGAKYHTVGVYTPDDFLERLNRLREVYHDYKIGAKMDFTRLENDPWADVSPWEVAHLIQDHPEVEHARQRLQAVAQLEEQNVNLMVELETLKSNQGKDCVEMSFDLDFDKTDHEQFKAELRQQFLDLGMPQAEVDAMDITLRRGSVIAQTYATEAAVLTNLRQADLGNVSVMGAQPKVLPSVAHLADQHASITAELEEMKSKHDEELKKVQAEAAEEATELKRQLEEATQLQKKTEEETKSLKAEYEKLSPQLQESEKALSDAKKELADVTAKRDDLASELEDMKKAMGEGAAELEGHLHEAKMKVKELEAQRQQLEESNQELQSKLKDHETTKAELEGHKASVKELEERKKQLEASHEDLQSKLKDHDTTKAELEDHKASVKELEERKQQLEASHEDLQSKLKDHDTTKAELEDHKASVKELEERKQQLEASHEDLQSKLQDHESTKAKLDEHKTAIQELEEHKKQSQASHQDLHSKLQDHESTKEQLGEHQTKLKELEEQKQQLEASKEELQKSLEEVQKSLTDSKQELSEVKSDMGKGAAELEGQLHEQKTKVKKLEEDKEQLETSKKDLLSKLEDHDKELEKTKKQLDEAKQEVHVVKAEAAEKAAEMLRQMQDHKESIEGWHAQHVDESQQQLKAAQQALLDAKSEHGDMITNHKKATAELNILKTEEEAQLLQSRAKTTQEMAEAERRFREQHDEDIKLLKMEEDIALKSALTKASEEHAERLHAATEDRAKEMETLRQQGSFALERQRFELWQEFSTKQLKLVEEHAEEVQTLHENRAQERVERQRDHEDERNRLADLNAKAMQKLQLSERNLQDAVRTHDEEKRRMQESQKDQIEEILKDHEEEKAKLQNVMKSELRAMEVTHGSKVQDIEESNRLEVEKLRLQQTQERQRLEIKAKMDNESLQATNALEREQMDQAAQQLIRELKLTHEDAMRRLKLEQKEHMLNTKMHHDAHVMELKEKGNTGMLRLMESQRESLQHKSKYDEERNKLQNEARDDMVLLESEQNERLARTERRMEEKVESQLKALGDANWRARKRLAEESSAEVDRLRTEQETLRQRLTEDSASKLAALSGQFDQERSRLVKIRDAEVEAANAEHREATDKLEEAESQAAAKLFQSQARMVQAQGAQARQLESIQSEHQAEFDRLRKALEQETTRVREQLQEDYHEKTTRMVREHGKEVQLVKDEQVLSVAKMRNELWEEERQLRTYKEQAQEYLDKHLRGIDEHAKEMKLLKDNHESTLEKHSDEMQEMADTHFKAVQSLHDGHATQLGELTGQHGSMMDNLRKEEAELQQLLKKEHDDLVQSIEERHEQTLKSMTENHEEALRLMGDRHDSSIQAVKDQEEHTASWQASHRETELLLQQIHAEKAAVEEEMEQWRATHLDHKATSERALESEIHRAKLQSEHDRSRLQKSFEVGAEAEEQIRSLEMEHEMEVARVREAFEQEHREVADNHEAAMAKAEGDWRAEEALMKYAFDETHRELHEAHSETKNEMGTFLQQQKDEHASQLAELMQEHGAKHEELHANYKADFEKLYADHDDHKTGIVAGHQDELARMRDVFELEEAILNEQHERSQLQLSRAEAEHQEVKTQLRAEVEEAWLREQKLLQTDPESQRKMFEEMRTLARQCVEQGGQELDRVKSMLRIHTPEAVCPSCGNVFLEDSKFCRKCGASRGVVRPVQVGMEKERKQLEEDAAQQVSACEELYAAEVARLAEDAEEALAALCEKHQQDHEKVEVSSSRRRASTVASQEQHQQFLKLQLLGLRTEQQAEQERVEMQSENTMSDATLMNEVRLLRLQDVNSRLMIRLLQGQVDVTLLTDEHTQELQRLQEKKEGEEEQRNQGEESEELAEADAEGSPVEKDERSGAAAKAAEEAKAVVETELQVVEEAQGERMRRLQESTAEDLRRLQQERQELAQPLVQQQSEQSLGSWQEKLLQSQVSLLRIEADHGTSVQQLRKRADEAEKKGAGRTQLLKEELSEATEALAAANTELQHMQTAHVMRGALATNKANMSESEQEELERRLQEFHSTHSQSEAAKDAEVIQLTAELLEARQLLEKLQCEQAKNTSWMCFSG
eukprot:TRINITY_DN11689_c0_g1_i2.p1 TRINITY_DN11689_c0_g1~~TRINITY_DN11689_c0_g1_i2.p1  ORF type:complete len:2784 (+),score=1034.82 TRINITY_DN11689_c0_g1_i2:198-8549(+)